MCCQSSIKRTAIHIYRLLFFQIQKIYSMGILLNNIVKNTLDILFNHYTDQMSSISDYLAHVIRRKNSTVKRLYFHAD